MFSLKSLRIVEKKCIYDCEGTLDPRISVLWHLLVNILLPPVTLGYILFTCNTAEDSPAYCGGNSASGFMALRAVYSHLVGSLPYTSPAMICIGLFVSYGA